MALSYAVLCCHLGKIPPGTVTIPERIVRNKFPYWDALEAADEAFAAGRVDVSQMSGVLAAYLAEQIREGE